MLYISIYFSTWKVATQLPCPASPSKIWLMNGHARYSTEHPSLTIPCLTIYPIQKYIHNTNKKITIHRNSINNCLTMNPQWKCHSVITSPLKLYTSKQYCNLNLCQDIPTNSFKVTASMNSHLKYSSQRRYYTTHKITSVYTEQILILSVYILIYY